MSNQARGNIILYLVITLLVIALLGMGIYYFFFGRANNNVAIQNNTIPTSIEPEDLDKELKSLDLGDVDSEFREVDSDLNSL